MLALNSALANGFAAFPDQAEPVKAHVDFIPVVAANTYGRGADRLYIGANQLDASTLDRFAVLSWDYDETLERSLAGDAVLWKGLDAEQRARIVKEIPDSVARRAQAPVIHAVAAE